MELGHPLTKRNIFDVNARRPVNKNTPFDERLKTSEKMREKLHSNPNKEARIKKIKQIRAQTAQKAQAEKAKFFYEPNTEIASTIQYMTNHQNATGVWCVLHPTLLQYSIIGTFIETITVRALKDYDTVGVPQDFLKFYYKKNNKTRLFTEEEINKLPIAYKEETEEINKLPIAYKEETEEIAKFGEIYTHKQQMEYGVWLNKDDNSIETYFHHVDNENTLFVKNCDTIRDEIISHNAGSEANLPQSREAWTQGFYNNLYDNVMLFQQKYPRKSIKDLIKLVETMNADIKTFISKNNMSHSQDEYDNQSDSNFNDNNMFKEFRDLYIRYYGSMEANNKEITLSRGPGSPRISHSDVVILLMQADLDKHIQQNIKAGLAPAPAPAVRPPDAQVSAAAGPSASAAPPASVFSSLGKYLGNVASGAKSGVGYLGNAVNYGVGSAANALRASTGFHQDVTAGMVFDKGTPSPPPVKPYLHPSSIDVEPLHADMTYRQGWLNESINNPNYHGTRKFVPNSNEKIWSNAVQLTGEQKAAAANKMSLFGGKKKSKRKQRKSQKQKKSRKQRR